MMKRGQNHQKALQYIYYGTMAKDTKPSTSIDQHQNSIQLKKKSRQSRLRYENYKESNMEKQINIVGPPPKQHIIHAKQPPNISLSQQQKPRNNHPQQQNDIEFLEQLMKQDRNFYSKLIKEELEVQEL
jgi:hypothetical protein